MCTITFTFRLQKQELARPPSSNLIVTVFILNVTEGGFTPAPTVGLQIGLLSELIVEKIYFV